MTENAIQRRAARRQAREDRDARVAQRVRSGGGASSMLLWAGGGATAASLALRLMGKNKAATIVAACGTSLLLARMVAKMVEKRQSQAPADTEQSATHEYPEHPSVSPALTA